MDAGKIDRDKRAGAGSKQEKEGQKWKMQGGVNQKSIAGMSQLHNTCIYYLNTYMYMCNSTCT